jgi:precorrin-2 dehydrogenase / sirohydrochlorin ferrochelatase
MSLFPMFVKLHDRLCVVVGGGHIAESKIAGLLTAEAKVRVIAPEVTESLAAQAREGQIEWLRKAFDPADLNGAYLVVAATSATEVNHQVFGEAEARGILCNAVDDPDYCHFYYPSVLRRGALQIAISTEGLSPALAQRLRRDLELQFGPEYGLWLNWLGAARKYWRAQKHDPVETRQLLHQLASQEMFDKFLQETAHANGNGSDR